jgi:hypothetical protein
MMPVDVAEDAYVALIDAYKHLSSRLPESADTERFRRSKIRSSRRASVAAAFRSRCSYKKTGSRRLASSQS